MPNITDHLTRPEISLLYNALLYYKEQSENALASAVLHNGGQLQKDLFKYVEQSTKALLQKIFGETFIDELELTEHFNKYRAELKEAEKGPLQHHQV